MKLRIKSLSGRVPKYATSGAAGVDLQAYLEDPITLEPFDRMLVPTGIFVEIPDNYEGQVRARSGLAIKHGIGLVNSVGTIDADYRGELKVPLINLGKEPFVINDGDRIAQLVIARYEKVTFDVCLELSDTDRGEAGFGHTGV